MGFRVLVVDDAMFMRNMLRDVFSRSEDFEVVGEAADGKEAVEKFFELTPDLVTMDIVMPLKSGIEALQEIVAKDPKACVIMCSALGQESLIVEAVQSGARDFIVKPFQESRVLEIARRVVTRA